MTQQEENPNLPDWTDHDLLSFMIANKAWVEKIEGHGYQVWAFDKDGKHVNLTGKLVFYHSPRAALRVAVDKEWNQ